MNHHFSCAIDEISLVPMSYSACQEYRLLRNSNCVMFGDEHEISKEEQKKWYEDYLANDNEYMFAIICCGNFIGGCGIYNVERGVGMAEFGRIIIDSSYRAKGYATKALIAACSVARTYLQLSRLCLFVKKRNYIAIKMYIGSGFELLRDDISKDNDLYCYMRKEL